MSRVSLILSNVETRKKAAAWVMNAPPNARFELRESKRSTPQNALLWARLTEISRAVPWHGVRLTPEDFKEVFMAALNTELRMVPNLDGTGFVNLGRSTSSLSKAEFGDLLLIIERFAAERGITLSDGAGASGG